MDRDFSIIGKALSSPARSTFVNLLMDGSRRPASELAAAARVSPSTASEHLAVLLDAGLVVSTPRGRQRFYQLADASVASAFEQLGHLCPPSAPMGYTQTKQARALADARLCYDHLAGRLGVAVTEQMVQSGWLTAVELQLTEPGSAALGGPAFNLDLATLRAKRRPLTRSCPDWTERKSHVAGALGAAIATSFLEHGWVIHRRGSRGLDVTPAGTTALTQLFGFDAVQVQSTTR